MKKTFTEKYADWVIKRKWPIVITTFLLFAIISFGAKFLTIEGDLGIYFPKDMPQLKALNNIHDEYSKTDNVLLVLVPKNKNIFTNQNLQTTEDLVKELWKAPFVNRVDAITNFQHTIVTGDELAIKDLAENSLQKTKQELNEIKKIALNDKELVKRLVSPSGHVTGIYCTINFPKKDFLNEGPELVNYIKSLKKKYENENLEILLTGTVLVDAAFAESGEQDMSTLFPIMYLIILIFLFFCFRTVSGTLTSMFILFMSISIAMGTFGYLGFKINTSTAVAPIMIMIIVLADAIHFVTTLIQYLRSGLDKFSAVKESIKVNLKPIFLTSFTNAIGYLSMNFSDSPPFQEWGTRVSIGIMTGFVLSILFLPAMMSILPIRKFKPIPFKEQNSFFTNLGKYIVGNRNKVFITCTLLSLTIGAFSYKNEVNDMFLDYFEEDMPIIKDTKFIVENLTGVYTIEYSLKSEEPGGITSPEYLKKVEEFENWFKRQKKVIHVSSFVSTIKRINKLMNGDKAEFNTIPKEKAQADQFLLLYEMSLPFGRDLNNQVNMDKSATRFTVTFENMYTSDLKEIELSANDWLKKNAPEHMWFDGTSTSIMFRYLADSNMDYMIYGFGTALLTIALIIMIATKSIKMGILSMIPNTLPCLVGFGIWGLAVGKIGMAVAFVSSITMGIAVDDTIHFVSKYLDLKRKENMDSESAIIETFTNVGVSMLNTSIVLIAGFAVLTFSPFELNSSLGILCSITLAFALILDFLLTPALLLIFDTKKRKEVKSKNIEKVAEIA